MTEIKTLGEGTCGVVTEVEIDGKRYARKSYKELYCPSAEREFSILDRIRHPNIIRVYNLNKKGGKLYADMELCDCHLSDFQDGTPTENDMIQGLHDLLCALEFLHQRNLVHGDVKPHNIYMKDRVLKLADFGTAQVSSRQQLLTTTSWWRAPEVIIGRKHTPAIDMWGFGAVMYDYATGEDFSAAATEKKILNLQLKRLGCPLDWPYISVCTEEQLQYPVKQLDLNHFPVRYESVHELNRLLNGCLQFNAKKRLTAAEALELPLFSHLKKPKGIWLKR